MKRAGKRIAILCAAACLAAISVAGIAFRKSIHAQWLARKLPSMGEEEGWRVAEKLLAMRAGPRRAAEEWFLERVRSKSERWKEAVEVLGARGSADCIPGLVEFLAAQEKPGYWNFQNDPEAWFALGSIHERHEEQATRALLRVLREGETSQRWWAARFFASIGPLGAAALPDLKAALRDPDPYLRAEVAMALYEVGEEKETFLPVVIGGLREKDDEAVTRFAAVVFRMGGEAVSTLPVLLDMLHGRYQDWEWLESAVAGMGGAAVPSLIDLLGYPQVRVRSSAARILGKMGSAAAPAIDSLGRGLSDADRGAAEWAAGALGKIGPGARAAVPDLLSIVENGRDDPLTRRCVEALGLIGPEAATAAPALITLLKTGSERVAPPCAMAVVRIGIEGEISRRAAEVIPQLERIRSGPLPTDSIARVQAACALSLFDAPRKAELLPEILRFLDNTRDPGGQLAAAEALGYLGKSDASITRALMEKALDQKNSLRWQAVRSLKRIGADVSGVFLSALKDPDEFTRASTVEALGMLAPEDPRLIPALLEALRDSDGSVRSAAAGALGALGPRALGAVPALEAALKDRHRGFRQAAAAALKSIRDG